MEKFSPIHLIVIIAIVVIGAGIIFKGAGNGAPSPAVTNTQSTEIVSQPAKPVATDNISNRADNIPPPITRTENEVVKVELEAVQLVAEIADGTTYEYWTFNKTVPGPFLRVMEGDTVEVSVSHAHDHTAMSDVELEEEEALFHSFTLSSFINTANAQEHEHSPGTPDDHGHGDSSEGVHAMPDGTVMDVNGNVLSDAEVMSDGSIKLGSGEIVGGGGMSDEEHKAAGHGEHSVDLHAVQGALGGADGSRAAPNQTETFRFRADKAGIFLYHCGSPHVATHIANGMYGMILVEPKGGLPPVDHEYYVVEGELYTSGAVGETGHQEFSKEKMVNEDPEYVVFNGKPGALTGDAALIANVGDTVRLFVAASGQVASNFHVIGEIFDRVYREGDLLSPPAQNVQTTMVPAGGATMVEFGVEYPGTYVLVDHALSRALDRGAAGHLIVTGEPDPELYQKIE